MMKQATWVFLAACLVVSVTAADKTAEAADKVDKTSVAPASSSTSGHDMMPMPYYNMLMYGGGAAGGLLLVALVIGLVMQAFGLKACQLLGNCDTSAAYSAGTAYQNDGYYSGQTQYTYPSGNTYQKRSVDYVGPVINMLRSAYEKYGQNTLPLNKKLQ